MSRIFPVFIILILLLSSASAQEPIQVFGFFQTRLMQVNGTSDVIARDVPVAINPQTGMPVFQDVTVSEVEEDRLTADIQQLNLFFRKEIDPRFTAWVNLELTNTYSSERGWGTINLEEAWLRYTRTDAFVVKAGLLIPKFNSMNEIKNRMPLLPYIIRPLVYEASLSAIFNQGDFIPGRAFVQVYGSIPVGKAIFNYAVHAGHAEKEYFVSGDAVGAQVAGTDTTTFKAFGGRAGVEYGNVKAGVSFTYDYDNQYIPLAMGVPALNQDVPRTRLGADLAFTLGDAYFEGEFIQVTEDPDTDPVLGDVDLDKMFYYGTAGYNFTDQWFGYGSYSYIEDNAVDFLGDGMQSYLVGFGFRPAYSVVLKAQYAHYVVDNGTTSIPIPEVGVVPGTVDIKYDAFGVALSIIL